MSEEMVGRRARLGRVSVVCGPMFAGKSEELMRRVRRARLAGLRVEVVSHALDTRPGAAQIASHSGLAVEAVSFADVDAFAAHVAALDLDLLAIDEAQFFGPGVVDVVLAAAARGVHVIVGGLSATYDGQPFEPVPTLMALAEDVTKLTAVCVVCGEDAVFHEKVAADAATRDPHALVSGNIGGLESYEARCRRHHSSASRRGESC